MICNVGAGVERNGHAGGGALVQGAVCQGAQEKPGQLTNMGHALDEFFRPAEKAIQTGLTIQSAHIPSKYFTTAFSNEVRPPLSLVILTLVAWWMADDKAREDNAPQLCYRGDCLC